jgi:hypothetical protein
LDLLDVFLVDLLEGFLDNNGFFVLVVFEVLFGVLRKFYRMEIGLFLHFREEVKGIANMLVFMTVDHLAEGVVDCIVKADEQVLFGDIKDEWYMKKELNHHENLRKVVNRWFTLDPLSIDGYNFKLDEVIRVQVLAKEQDESEDEEVKASDDARGLES